MIVVEIGPEVCMKALWHGSLVFELVNIPIRLYPATRQRRVELRLLHEPDLAPIRLPKVCSAEDRPVPDEEIVRGFATAEGWIVVDPSEIEALAPIATHTIEVREFADLHEVDPIYNRRPYYLAPDDGGLELYVMLREAIRRSGKVGIAEFVLLRRQHLAILRPLGEALVLETLHYPEELIDEHEIDIPATTLLREAEIRMAVEVIERRSRRPFEISSYRNEYRERILDLVREKAAGRLPRELMPATTPSPTPVIDLTRRLRESLERVRREEERRAA
jgi:DNA end-binding protein Ku